MPLTAYFVPACSQNEFRALTLQLQSTMSLVRIHDIILSEKAKTTDHAFSIVQHVRSTVSKSDDVVLDFSGITWITSMFADRLVKAMATFYGPGYEKKLKVTGIEDSNVMFDSLWKSALDKFRYGSKVYAQA